MEFVRMSPLLVSSVIDWSPVQLWHQCIFACCFGMYDEVGLCGDPKPSPEGCVQVEIKAQPLVEPPSTQ